MAIDTTNHAGTATVAYFLVLCDAGVITVTDVAKDRAELLEVLAAAVSADGTTIDFTDPEVLKAGFLDICDIDGEPVFHDEDDVSVTKMTILYGTIISAQQCYCLEDL